jgi:hypothetical protein
MKVNKSNFGWIFASIFLFILLAISVYLGLSGWYFKTESSLTTDLKIGQTVQLDLDKNSANAVSMNLSGSYLEGQMLPQIISIKNISNDDIFVRAKIFIYTSDNQTKKIGVSTSSNWTLDEEEKYYYLNEPLSSSGKVSFCSNIVILDDSGLWSSKDYIVTVVAESLDADQDISSIWRENV